MITIDIDACDVTKLKSDEFCSENPQVWLEDKSIILLVNNKHVDYDVDYREPQVLKYTDMFWVPFTIQTPQTT